MMMMTMGYMNTKRFEDFDFKKTYPSKKYLDSRSIFGFKDHSNEPPIPGSFFRRNEHWEGMGLLTGSKSNLQWKIHFFKEQQRGVGWLWINPDPNEGVVTSWPHQGSNPTPFCSPAKCPILKQLCRVYYCMMESVFKKKKLKKHPLQHLDKVIFSSNLGWNLKLLFGDLKLKLKI